MLLGAFDQGGTGFCCSLILQSPPGKVAGNLSALNSVLYQWVTNRAYHASTLKRTAARRRPPGPALPKGPARRQPFCSFTR